MTNKVIIDYTQCKYNTFDGGGSQRTICSLDGKYCDCLRDKECYYKQLKRKEQENKKLKYYLNKIREDELNSMDVEWDEYITECTSTEYTNVITFVELALGERDE